MSIVLATRIGAQIPFTSCYKMILGGRTLQGCRICLLGPSDSFGGTHTGSYIPRLILEVLDDEVRGVVGLYSVSNHYDAGLQTVQSPA